MVLGATLARAEARETERARRRARPARLPACWLSALVLVATWPLPAACSLARYKYTVQDAEGISERIFESVTVHTAFA